MKKLCTIIVTIFLITIISIVVLKHDSNKYDEYDLPYNISVVDLIDSNNIFIKKNNDSNIYKYNIKTNDYILFKKPQIQGNNITTMQISKKWVAWIEANDNEQILYTENRKSKKVSKLLENNYQILQLNNNFLIYLKTDTNKIYLILKDLDATNKEIILDNKDVNGVTNITIPSISNCKVVWSKDKLLDENRKLISSTVYMYDIKSKQKRIISNQANIFKPKINNDIIVGTCLKSNDNYTESYLTKYNLESNKWENIISQKSDIYKNLKYVSIDDPIVDDNKMTWWDNYSKNMYLYNFKNKEITILNKKNSNNQINQIYFMKNNIIFYRIASKDNSKQFQKCIVLKKSYIN